MSSTNSILNKTHTKQIRQLRKMLLRVQGAIRPDAKHDTLWTDIKLTLEATDNKKDSSL